MADFLLNLLKTTLLGGLVIAALLLSKPLWRERYRAKTRCALWLALAVFLLLPIDFSVENAPVQLAAPKDYTVFVGGEKTTVQETENLFGALAESRGQTSAQVRDEFAKERGETVSAAKGTVAGALEAQRYIPLATLLFAAYLTGAVGFLAVQGVLFLSFRHSVRRWRREVTRSDYRALLSDTARDFAVKAPRMIVCPAVTTPAVTGAFRPTLLLPHEDYDVSDLRFILRHELCHLKRRDMLLKLTLLAANAMHWFNPLVYLMLRQADEDIELACDSAATGTLAREERAAYSRTLLAAVQTKCRAVPATTCFGGTVERLKRRITNVLGAQKKRGLGLAALVLAATLAAGCATSWGGKKELKFDGTVYDAALVWQQTAFTEGDGLFDAAYPAFRLEKNADGENTVVMLLSEKMEYMEYEYPLGDLGDTLSREIFEPLFYDTAGMYELVEGKEVTLSGGAYTTPTKLREANKTCWGCCKGKEPAVTAKGTKLPNELYLLAQEDGSLYLALGYHHDPGTEYPDGFSRFFWLFRLSERGKSGENASGVRCESMEAYFEELMEKLKADTMRYYVEESAEYPGGVTDQVADARMTDAVRRAGIEDLATDGAVLELWSYRYERKPVNEKGLTIMLVGGQTLSDDGYLDDGFTHYLVVLHRADGENAGYEIIGTCTENDGLWYDGVGYGDEYAAYLHDFYVDFAGLSAPKQYIGDLLEEEAADGYGNSGFVEAQLINGNGYYFYAPLYGWKNNAGTQYWYSGYDTGSWFNVHLREQSIGDAAAEWSATGAEKTALDNGYRFVTNEGLSNTAIYLFAAPNGTQHYEVSTHWEYDGSEDNEWGWNHDRAVEEEAKILTAMAESFRVSEETEYVPGFARDLDLASSENGAAALALREEHAFLEIATPEYSVEGTWNRPMLNACDYAAADASDVPQDGARLTLWLKNNDASWFTFYKGTNLVSYHVGLNDPVEYYEAQGDFSITDGDGRTIFDCVRSWYDEAELLALRNDLPQISAETWEEAAKRWIEEYYAVYQKVTSGSRFCYTWVETETQSAPDATKMLRRNGEIGENEYCFYATIRFVAENEASLSESMAGNTGECSDPNAPAGAYEYSRCCSISLGEDGFWHGTVFGTGW